MSAKPKVDLDAVAAKCAVLKLSHAAECLSELVEEAARDNLQPLRFLDRVLERKNERKNERRIATSLKLSGMPGGLTLEGFDWTFQPRVDRAKLEALATCAYVRQKENVLFLGPPGVGKSHLAVALGVKAVKNGFSVTHFVLDELMHALRSDAAIPPARPQRLPSRAIHPLLPLLAPPRRTSPRPGRWPLSQAAGQARAHPAPRPR